MHPIFITLTLTVRSEHAPLKIRPEYLVTMCRGTATHTTISMTNASTFQVIETPEEILLLCEAAR